MSKGTLDMFSWLEEKENKGKAYVKESYWNFDCWFVSDLNGWKIKGHPEEPFDGLDEALAWCREKGLEVVKVRERFNRKKG